MFQDKTWIKMPKWKPFLKYNFSGNSSELNTDKRTDVWSRPSCIYTQIFSPKKWVHVFGVKKKFKFFFKRVLCNFSVQTLKCQKFDPETWKYRPQKLLIIGPDPFISQSRPDQSPQARIDVSYFEISGPDICSLICELSYSAIINYK